MWEHIGDVWSGPELDMLPPGMLMTDLGLLVNVSEDLTATIQKEAQGVSISIGIGEGNNFHSGLLLHCESVEEVDSLADVVAKAREALCSRSEES